MFDKLIVTFEWKQLRVTKIVDYEKQKNKKISLAGFGFVFES